LIKAALFNDQCVLRIEETVPNPKRRHSKTRTAKRRTHDALKPVPVGTCPQCQEAKAPHQVCPHCGYYKGRQVKAVEEA
jgi:large subunit ribosomal protein L32